MRTNTAARFNPQTTRNVAGVASNHSSTTPSTETMLPENHAQFDDMLDDVHSSQDPNISGSPDMSPLYDPIAGPLNPWEENDDYRDFLQKGVAPISRIFGEDMDADFDSNHGIPTSLPSYNSGYVRDTRTSIGTVITRRI